MARAFGYRSSLRGVLDLGIRVRDAGAFFRSCMQSSGVDTPAGLIVNQEDRVNYIMSFYRPFDPTLDYYSVHASYSG